MRGGGCLKEHENTRMMEMLCVLIETMFILVYMFVKTHHALQLRILNLLYVNSISVKNILKFWLIFFLFIF